MLDGVAISSGNCVIPGVNVAGERHDGAVARLAPLELVGILGVLNLPPYLTGQLVDGVGEGLAGDVLIGESSAVDVYVQRRERAEIAGGGVGHVGVRKSLHHAADPHAHEVTVAHRRGARECAAPSKVGL